jgi:hypothetical protein
VAQVSAGRQAFVALSVNAADWLRVFTDTLRECGIAADLAGESVVVGALDVRVESLDVQAAEPQFATAHVVVVAANLRINLIGFDPDPLEASRVAARQWIELAFPVLHASMHPDHRERLGVATFELLSFDHEREKAYAWLLHLSSVLLVPFGSALPAERPGQLAMVEQLFDELRPISTAERRLVLVEASASRLLDGTDSSVYVAGVPWPSSEDVLRDWARGWPSGFGNLMVKQFMLLEQADRASVGAAFRADFDKAVEASNSMIAAQGGDRAGWVTTYLGAARA